MYLSNHNIGICRCVINRTNISKVISCMYRSSNVNYKVIRLFNTENHKFPVCVLTDFGER